MICSQCGFDQHIEGKFCTNCGAALPLPEKAPTRSPKVVLILIGVVVFFCGFGGLIIKLAENPQKPIKPAQPYPDLVTIEPMPTVPPLSPEEIRELLREDYQLTMQAAHSHLNFIKAKISKTKGGYALMARHTYFGQYTLKAGGTAGVISGWIDLNESKLKQAGIVRVGVETDEDFGGASWFNVK